MGLGIITGMGFLNVSTYQLHRQRRMRAPLARPLIFVFCALYACVSSVAAGYCRFCVSAGGSGKVSHNAVSPQKSFWRWVVEVSPGSCRCASARSNCQLRRQSSISTACSISFAIWPAKLWRQSTWPWHLNINPGNSLMLNPSMASSLKASTQKARSSTLLYFAYIKVKADILFSLFLAAMYIELMDWQLFLPYGASNARRFLCLGRPFSSSHLALMPW